MDTEHQAAAINGSSHVVGAEPSRLITDGRVRAFQPNVGEADSIIDMLQRVHEESPRLSRNAFSRAQATKTVFGLFRHVDGFTVVAYKNAKMIGCMGGILSPELTSDAKVASEMLLYVEPDARGSNAALLMVAEFQSWAGDNEMIAGSSLGINDALAIRFYERLGFKQMGISLSKSGTE